MSHDSGLIEINEEAVCQCIVGLNVDKLAAHKTECKCSVLPKMQVNGGRNNLKR